MRRKLLYFPIAILTFLATLFLTPYNPTSGLRGMILRVLSVTEDFGTYDRIPSTYDGAWGGPGSDVVGLYGRYITDVQNGKSYRYRLIRHFRYPDGNHPGYLIEVIGLGTNSNLRNYVYLGFDGDQMGFFGYNSLDDFDLGQASASGSFIKRHCHE
jgi:hypothetical protein